MIALGDRGQLKSKLADAPKTNVIAINRKNVSISNPRKFCPYPERQIGSNGGTTEAICIRNKIRY